MHQIGVVGLSYRHAGVDDIARFSLPKAEVGARLPALRGALEAGELLYLGTCNRVEVLYTTLDGSPAGDGRRAVFRALIGREPQPGEANRVLRAWTGEAALEHLFLVACGLDSAQAGEQEIAAQIRGAWEASRAAKVSGPTLDRLVAEALGMATRVHRLEAGVPAPSLADLAADRVLAHMRVPNLAGAAGTSPERLPVALLGVSPMTKRCAMALHRAGLPLVVVNRTLEPAEEFAQAVAGRALSLDEFRTAPIAVGALVLAAGGGEAILDPPALARLAEAAAGQPAPLLVDFGVPPNVDPRAARMTGLERVGMDELIRAAQERRLAELMRLAPVRAAIDERLAFLRDDLAARAIGRKLADLRAAFEQIAADEADRALTAEFRGLDGPQRELLRKFASTVARRLAHLPIAGMRAVAAHAGAEAVDAFFREARLRRNGSGAEHSVARPGIVARVDSTELPDDAAVALGAPQSDGREPSGKVPVLSKPHERDS
jgi:glutamyl-tRNA reductase